ncbi:MAG: hypothetical protein R3B90_14510 [Planctomycetaceae bacterium]
MMVLGALSCFVGLTAFAQAQLPQTRLKAIEPVSMQVGQTIELKLLSGDDLDEVTSLHFSHPGITAKLKMQEVDGQPRPVDNTFEVSAAGDVPPGVYEVRCSGMWGVSNPRRFGVSQRPHAAEASANNTVAAAQAIELNSSVVGRMESGTDIDCFKFTAAQGQKVVIDCLAERLDSSMNATLTLKDAQGRRLARVRNFNGEDPTLVYTIPSAGEYVVELNDQTYRSGNEFGYRLDVHAGPHLSFAMPPAGPAGQRTRFTLYGFNLPGAQQIDDELHAAKLEKLEVDIDVPQEEATLRVQNVLRSYQLDVDAFSYSLSTPSGPTNPLLIGIASRAVAIETEPNDDPAKATPTTAPGEVAGQISRAGDVDWYSFPAEAGQVYWLEVVGQRNGTTLDPVMIVEQVTKNEQGEEQVKRLVTQDDDGTNVAANVFDTFTDDPVYRLNCEAAATYRVAVYDRYGQTRGDLRLRYRLSIRPEEPDFRVAVVPALNMNNSGQPWPIGLRKGDSVSVPLYALRKYGYEGPIDVRVEGLGQGVHCPGTTIGTKEAAGVLVFRSDAEAPESVQNLRLIATARIAAPAQERAVASAAKAIEDAKKPLPDLQKKLGEADTKLAQATQQRDETAKQSQDKPDDEGLKKQLEQRQAQLDEAQKQRDAAAQMVAAAEQAIVAAKQAHEQAKQARQASIREVSHVVRSGTLMVPGANNEPSEGRLAQSLTLAVMPEQASFEVRTEPVRVRVCQSAQVLVPVKLIKRNGFDEKVTLNFAGMPNGSNLQATNTAIEKGQDAVVASVLVKENTPPGTYALYLTSQGQVSYSRNPAKAERLKAARDAVGEELKKAQEAAQAATQAKTESTNKANEANQKLQQAQQQKQQADQLVQQRTTELGQIKPQKEAADKKLEEQAKALAEAEQGQKTQEQGLADAEKAQSAAEQAQAAAEKAVADAQAALQGDPENGDLKNKVTAAEQQLQQAKLLVEQTKQKVNEAKQLLEQAKQKFAQAKQQAEQATRERDEKVKQLAEAEARMVEAVKAQEAKAAELKIAETAKAEADKAKQLAEEAEKAALAEAKRLDDKKKAADKLAQDAETAAKPQNKNVTPPSLPIVIEVLPAPVKLTVSVPNGGNIKRGESIELTAKVDRLNGYEGPVQLSLPLPPGVQGVSASGSIPADQVETKFNLTAGGDATEGQLANIVLRATVTWDGEQHVEVPIAVKVSP